MRCCQKKEAKAPTEQLEILGSSPFVSPVVNTVSEVVMQGQPHNSDFNKRFQQVVVAQLLAHEVDVSELLNDARFIKELKREVDLKMTLHRMDDFSEMLNFNVYEIMEQEMDSRINSSMEGSNSNRNEFEQAVFNHLCVIFNRTFKDLREAMIQVRITQQEGQPLKMDWRALGNEFGWDKKRANNTFYMIQSAVLDKWPREQIAAIQEDTRRFWQETHDKKAVMRMLDHKYRFREQFEKDPKQVNNIIDYQLRKLKAITQ